MKEKGVLYKVCLTNLLLGLGLYSAIEVAYLQSKNISLVYISALNLSIPLLTACLEIPTGIVGDWLGRKKVLHLTYISFSISTCILLFANHIAIIFLAYVLEALGWSFYSGNTESIIYELSEKKKLDTNRSLGNFYASLSVGYLLSGIIVGLLPGSYSEDIFKYALIATLIFRVVSTIIVYTLKGINSEGDSKKTPIELFRKTLKVFFKDKKSISICVYEAMGRLQFYLPVIYQPILFMKGMSVKQVAIIYSITQLAQSLSQKFSPMVVEKFKIPRLIKFGPIIQGLFLLLLVSNNFLLILLGVVVSYCAIPLKGQCITLLKHEEVDNEIRSTFLSVISLATLIINSIFLSICGKIISYNTIAGVTCLAITLIIISGIAVNNIIASSKDNLIKIEE
ncbi:MULTISPECIES: MFS transporter [Clostridium]|uniref:MFS transporter n=1 Tax=Clostridium cibarium TaxID=2762247 RepID=A0ABR8PW38_9CLOT|nr:MULTISPECIES: MFS transporter [Clostridium]MBD7912395.1 MFS transporter [Clostridium cibarium]